MSISVATWNVAERLGHEGYSPQIVEAVKSFDADVVALPDAYWLDNPLHEANSGAEERVEEAKESFAKEGYQSYTVQYDRPDHFPGRHLLLMSRAGGEFSAVKAADSAAARVVIPIEDEAPLQIVGVHLDDQSEENRVCQAEDLAVNLEIPANNTVLMGDFNAMNRSSKPDYSKAFWGAAWRVHHRT